MADSELQAALDEQVRRFMDAQDPVPARPDRRRRLAAAVTRLRSFFG